jgi:hypothetical protein
MGTHNGFGTLYYGWKHRPDGTAEATRWFVAAFFPVVPLRRMHVRVLDTKDPTATFLLLAGHGFGTRLEEIEQLPLDWRSILKTYLNGYVVVPVILIAPVAVLVGILLLLEGPGRQLGIDPKGVTVAIILTVVCLLYWGLVVAYILDHASGRRARTSSASGEPREPDSFHPM